MPASRERLALESGLSCGHLSSVERGVRNIALVNICVPAGTLGLSPSGLLDFGATLASACLPSPCTRA
ncbi:MAG: hypothetical protein QM674_17025 [Burkholderiaceae bacterium]